MAGPEPPMSAARPPSGDPPPADALSSATAPASPFWTPRRIVLVAALIASVTAFGVSCYLRNLPAAVIAGLALLIVCAIGGYKDGWTWTGIGPAPEKESGKTLWDMVQLLILPAILAFGGTWYSNQQSTAAEHQNEIRAHNQVLNDYVSQISDLMLNHGLLPTTNSQPACASRVGPAPAVARSPGSAQSSAIARARTLAALGQLDPDQDAIVLRFLIESGLIPTVDLSVVNLEGVNLEGVDLCGADLRYAWLDKGADFSWTNFEATQFDQAHLDGTDLSNADLRGAIMPRADLSGADLTRANLAPAMPASAASVTATPPPVQVTPAAVTAARLAPVKPTPTSMVPTNLSYANLTGAKLVQARLNHVDLIHAFLGHADLSGANLSYANLTGAQMFCNQPDTPRARPCRPLLRATATTNLSGVTWNHTRCPDGKTIVTRHPCPAGALRPATPAAEFDS